MSAPVRRVSSFIHVWPVGSHDLLSLYGANDTLGCREKLVAGSSSLPVTNCKIFPRDTWALRPAVKRNIQMIIILCYVILAVDLFLDGFKSKIRLIEWGYMSVPLSLCTSVALSTRLTWKGSHWWISTKLGLWRNPYLRIIYVTRNYQNKLVWPEAILATFRNCKQHFINQNDIQDDYNYTFHLK